MRTSGKDKKHHRIPFKITGLAQSFKKYDSAWTKVFQREQNLGSFIFVEVL